MKKRFFLEEVVDYTFRKYDDFRKLSIIFPNRRAGLYFQKALSKKTKKTTWSPKVQTMEEFVQGFTDIKISDDVADSILLNHYLFKTIQKHQEEESKVSFDNFYFWGQILIKDFDDVDLSLRDESKIFKLIKDQKEIDESFSFLDKENYEKIKSFWTKFFPTMSVNQKNFKTTWKILLNVYKDYKRVLLKNKIAYKGLVYKEFLKKISSEVIDSNKEYLFVGFNILSNSEKKIIKYFIKENSSMAFWDFDKYYYNDYKQEAGDAFREFSDDKILNSTFPKYVPDNFNSVNKKISSIGIGSQVGQSKVLGNLLSKKINNKNFDQDKVLILLPDENLLLPVLNSIPDSINKINVTMGLTLSETPLFSLVQLIIKIHKKTFIRDFKKCNYYKDVLELISHPYIYQKSSESSDKIISEIRDNKIIYVDHKYLIESSEVLNTILVEDDSIINILQKASNFLFNSSTDLGKLDREYIKSFLEILDRIKKINIEFKSLSNQSKLVNQIFKMIRIPFSGEPLSGLQVMGVLESRNLDFDDVYILSMNEGDFPRKLYNISFIPYNIRKGFQLETLDSMDKVYSYLFYRVIQRAKNITLIYNTNSSFSSKGEKSRYIKQVSSESNYKINDFSVTDKLEIDNKPKLSIPKSKEIIDKLQNRFYNGGYMSPSAIKDYMDCPLRFYYRYVANIREVNPISSEILKPDFGKITHKALEILYSDIIKANSEGNINKNDFFKLKNGVSGSLEKVIRAHFKLKKKNQFFMEGNNIILYEIMKDYIKKIISFDELYAPFEIIDLEGDKNSGYYKNINLPNNKIVKISGIVDRVDKKNNLYRIIDYKTGGDTKRIKDIDSLFSDKRTERNDAVFQLFYYSLLLHNKLNDNLPIRPGLMNIREINNKNFNINIIINNKSVTSINEYLEDFEKKLIKKLSEIFDIKVPFTQNDDENACKYCSYKNLCSR